MTWPTKDDFVNGDVLTAAQVNNIADNLNLFDPTSASANEIWIADGAGSGSYQALAAGGLTVISSNSMTGTSLTWSSIPQTYKYLMVIYRDHIPSAGGTVVSFTDNQDSAYSLATNYLSGNNSASVRGRSSNANIDSSTGYSASTRCAGWITFLNYTSTRNQKHGQYVFYGESSTSSQYMTENGSWAGRGTSAAITAITLNYPAASTPGTATLYGVS